MRVRGRWKPRYTARAGVSVQTLFLAWGSKRKRLRAYLESTLFPGGAPPAEKSASLLHAADPVDVVGQIARIFREDWQQPQTLRRGTFEILVARIPDTSLRLARPDAVDTAWAIASPDIYDLLVRRAGYSLDRFEEWIAATLRAVLLAE